MELFSNIKTVSRFRSAMARLFGKKFVNEDSGVRVTSYILRGTVYIDKVENDTLKN